MYKYSQIILAIDKSMGQRCVGVGVQESTPARVGVFQQEPEHDHEWIFFIRTGPGAGSGLTFSRGFQRFECIFAVYIICYTGVKQEQESIFEAQEHWNRLGVEKIKTPHTSNLGVNFSFFTSETIFAAYWRKKF